MSEADRARLWVRAVRATVVGLSGLAVTTAVFAVPAALPAVAAPALTVADAKAQIEQLEIDAAAIDQDYAGVQDQISKSRVTLTLKQSDTKVQTAKVAQMRRQVGQVALAQFQNRNLDTAAQLFFTEDTQGFLSQISTVEKVSDNQNTVLQSFQQEQASLADLQHSTETDLAALEGKQKELQSLRSASDKLVAESKAVLARLTEAERRAIAAQEKAAADKAKAEAEAAARAASANNPTSPTSASGPKNSTSTTKPTSTTGPAASGSSRGATALAFAKTQLGKPYRFGAAGPDAYDCSGLTSVAWEKAGVSLSRTAATQFQDGRAISRSELQPGDLVFFYSSTRPSHVALYAGNGIVLQSPRPGRSVEYMKMSYMPFSGARRPG